MKIIVIDLDDVLINSPRIKRDIFNAPSHCGVSLVQGKAIYSQLPRPFTLEVYTKALSSVDAPTAEKIMNHCHSLFKKTGYYNYPVKSFLIALSRKARLVLLTYGNQTYQKLKIEQSGLAHFFNQIIVTPQPDKSNVLSKLINQYGSDIVVVDDAVDVCASARRLGLKAVKVKKGSKDVIYYRALLKRIVK